MKIGNVNQSANHVGTYGSGQEDAYTKNIKNQIVQVQKEMQQLSSNQELSMEEKMKKRQELQQKITDLNNQLRQHQLEQRREKQEQSAAEKEKSEVKSQESVSKAQMQSMISADASMKQAKEQGSVKTKMKGEANVLKMEIKLDADRGGSVEAKQKELAKIDKKIADTEEAQFKQLGAANKTLKKATEDTAKRASDEEEKEEERKGEKEEKDKSKYPDGYLPVDVRL